MTGSTEPKSGYNNLKRKDRGRYTYYAALDLADSDDIAQILFLYWSNFLEKPFIFLGNLHHYLFRNLL
ncbi:hypothetical protein HYC85_003563 [Camellia sinensis]|uniref:Uncharacterized protein n=1 Tax=Camellia sinensis TaxID=4442 RepID=A0A7J7HWN9_CAMSI|nr:hypothetical protein HYC85_003563 [Camellia sinensis]